MTNVVFDKSNDEAHISWRTISPREHIVHIYEDDQSLLDVLEQFVVAGLSKGESVVVVATTKHLAEMNERLNAYNVSAAHLRHHYICLEAEKALSRFLIDGWPDAQLFNEFVNGILDQAGQSGRRVRVFGEMVAILWKAGNSRATIKLEQLWNKFCHTGAFPLLCAYPKGGFNSRSASIREICAAHSKVISSLDWLAR